MLKNTLLVAGLGVILCYAHAADAEIADDTMMARDALMPYVRNIDDSGARERKLEDYRANLVGRVDSAPKRSIAGTVVLSRGLTILQLSDIASNHDIEIFDIHIKAPYNDRGVIQSISIGAAELARHRGDFAQRADRAIASMRYKFLEWSESLSGEEAEAHRNIAYSPMLVYRFDAYGKATAMRDVFDRPDVAAVIADTDERSHEKIAMHREFIEQSRVAWQAYDERARNPQRR